MNFRTFNDMAQCIQANRHKLPNDVDVVVGVPRSGLLPANLIALQMNTLLTDVEGLLEGRLIGTGRGRNQSHWVTNPAKWRKILVVDDSLASGISLAQVKQKIDAASRNWEVIYCVIYAVEGKSKAADISLEICQTPRMFEWNFMHHGLLENACVDIDGVLCLDPTKEQNDDGPNYLEFLKNTPPLVLPTRKIGTLVSSRLEKYRPQTEDWLHRHGIRYDRLRLLDLPSAAIRIKTGAGSPFKAKVYRESKDSVIFIESELWHANQIALLSRKPVLCTDPVVFIKQPLSKSILNRLRHPRLGIEQRLLRAKEYLLPG